MYKYQQHMNELKIRHFQNCFNCFCIFDSRIVSHIIQKQVEIQLNSRFSEFFFLNECLYGSFVGAPPQPPVPRMAQPLRMKHSSSEESAPKGRGGRKFHYAI